MSPSQRHPAARRRGGATKPPGRSGSRPAAPGRTPSDRRPASGDAAGRLESLRKQADALRRRLRAAREFRIRLGALADKFAHLTRLSTELNTLDLDRLAKTAVEKTSLLLRAKYCSLFLYNYQLNELTLKRHNHPNEIAPRIAIRHHTNTIMGLALRTRRIVHIQDIDAYERENQVRFERTFADKYATRSCLCAPLMAGNLIVGILNIADRLDGAAFNEQEDLPAVEQISQILGIAIRNGVLFRELQNQARTDSLTQLDNYRSFHERLRSEIHRSLRYARSLALILFDIDNFKQINDRHGHPAGDYVLREIGRVVQAYVRREDLAARYGGDEIAIILPETPLAGAIIASERLLEVLRHHPFKYENQPLTVTVSIGVATLGADMNLSDFVRAADEALYRAKQKGKDRVEPGA
jgi:diguanylate cyclase (GGDEF)-like protein